MKNGIMMNFSKGRNEMQIFTSFLTISSMILEMPSTSNSILYKGIISIFMKWIYIDFLMYFLDILDAVKIW